MHWMILPYRRYFEFSGRSRRMEYWMFFLLWLLLLVAFGIGLVATFAGSWQSLPRASAMPFAGTGVGFLTLLVLFGLFFLASLIPMIAVQVRRLHDLGVSGWWYLGYIASGVLLPMVPNAGESLNGLVSVGWIVWMFFPGAKGPNKYGDDPKDPLSAEVFA